MFIPKRLGVSGFPFWKILGNGSPKLQGEVTDTLKGRTEQPWLIPPQKVYTRAATAASSPTQGKPARRGAKSTVPGGPREAHRNNRNCTKDQSADPNQKNIWYNKKHHSRLKLSSLTKDGMLPNGHNFEKVQNMDRAPDKWQTTVAQLKFKKGNVKLIQIKHEVQTKISVTQLSNEVPTSLLYQD